MPGLVPGIHAPLPNGEIPWNGLRREGAEAPAYVLSMVTGLLPWPILALSGIAADTRSFATLGRMMAMADTAVSAQDDTPKRPGFFRRFIASLIDFLIIALLIQVIGTLAYSLTNGRVQAILLAGSRTCERTTLSPDDLAILEGSTANSAIRCLHRFLGFPAGHMLTIGWRTRTENMAYESTIAYPVYPGSQSPVPTLDLLAPPAFLLFRWWYDRSGRQSPGRRMCRLQLVSLRNRSKEQFSQAVTRRYTILSLSFVPGALMFFLLMLAVHFGMTTLGSFFSIAFFVIIALIVIPAFPILLSVNNKKDTFYDRSSEMAVIGS